MNPNANVFVSSVMVLQKVASLAPNAPTFTPNSSVEEEESTTYEKLRNLRNKNVDKILIGHLNINSIRNKFDLLVDLVKDSLDILVISETTIDNSFPNSQFKIHGYSPPHRLDRTGNGGGLLFCTRADIPTKSLHLVSGPIECIICEIIISKKKWLAIGVYNPNIKTITKHLRAT